LIKPYTRCYISDRRYSRFSCLRNGGGELIIRAHAKCLIVEVFGREIGVIECFTPYRLLGGLQIPVYAEQLNVGLGHKPTPQEIFLYWACWRMAS
jgi:hypothetical protein